MMVGVKVVCWVDVKDAYWAVLMVEMLVVYLAVLMVGVMVVCWGVVKDAYLAAVMVEQ